MCTTFSQLMKKKFLLVFGLLIVGVSVLFGFSNPAFADTDVTTGFINDNIDAANKCPSVCIQAGKTWNGQWRRLDPPEALTSVCGCK